MKVPPVLQSGFRIFFFGAIVHTIISMAVWMWFYVAGGQIFVAMPLTVWHGHEMVFGFVMAVVAGFLLTAVPNWTGLPTVSGYPLLALFLVWVAARVLAFVPYPQAHGPMLFCSIAFHVALFLIVLKPIVQRKQWKQSAVLSKLLLIGAGEIVFFWALFQEDLVLERKALRFGVLLIISLILTIGRRILPFFIERGVDRPVTLRNSAFLDYTSLILLVALVILEVFIVMPLAAAAVSVLLAAVHTRRLGMWYTPGIGSKPLLWVLFAGYGFIVAGFLLRAIAPWAPAFNDAAMHAWTAGGIGLFVIGMMARVSWGHTGRSISDPPRMLLPIFLLLVAAASARVFGPLLIESRYILWIALSQVLWMAAFLLLAAVYLPVFWSARVDGKPG